MTRRVFPDNPLVVTAAAAGTALTATIGLAVRVYTDSGATTLANIQTMAGAAIGSSQLTIDTNSQLPLFKGPDDNTDTLHVRAVAGGAIGTIYARVDDRLDVLEAADESTLTGLLGPSTITGLVGWYAADHLTSLADGASVSSWADSSGTGNTATQGTGGDQPTLQTGEIGSKPVVRFDGAGDNLRADGLATYFGGSDAATSVVAVLKFTDVSGFYAWFGVGKLGSATAHYQFRNSSLSSGFYNLLKRDDANNLVNIGSGGGTTNTSYHVVSFVIPGTTAGAWVDGAVSIAAGAILDVGATTLDIAALGTAIGQGTNHFKGDLAELCVYNRALTTTERQQLEWHLGQKYGLTVDSTGFTPADNVPLRGDRVTVGLKGEVNTFTGYNYWTAGRPHVDARAFASIQAALDAGASGAVINLGPGEYSGSAVSSTGSLYVRPGRELRGASPVFGGSASPAGITKISGQSGVDIITIPDPGDEGAGHSSLTIRNLKLSGGRRQITATDVSTYVLVEEVECYLPEEAGVYLGGQAEEWTLRRVRLDGGQYGFRAINTASADLSINLLDKTRFEQVQVNGQTKSGWSLEKALFNSITWDNCIFNTSSEHGFILDGSARGLNFIGCNTEGNGQSGKNARTTGSISSASATLTVASGTGFANSDPITVAYAGASGGDLTTTISSGGGTTTLTLAATASTTVAGAAVTNAKWDDFYFTNVIAAPSEIVFTGCQLGSEGTGGKLRYAVNWPSALGYVVFVGSGNNATCPVYDPGKKTRVVNGQLTVRRPGYVNTLGEDLWPVPAAPTVTGSRGANAALASLLTTLAARGLIVDGSS